ncbi:MAG: hypothetical protein JW751_07450 [Polyangiaceae bacterium]|nr:hypothetical protein [Polyangiaceae bacterium]
MPNPHHTFHIAVMGIGFTIDTPLRVSRYGISSAISLVDDLLIEQLRRDWCERLGQPYQPIMEGADLRARRIAAYLTLVGRECRRRFAELQAGRFDDPQGILRYLELLPPDAPLVEDFRRWRTIQPGPDRTELETRIRAGLVPGDVDVNIMTKLDRAVDERGRPRPSGESDAVAALRGFAMSELEGAVILSAGLNPRVSGAIAEYDDFFPVAGISPKKRVILKVSDLRSAQVQGKLLSRRGIWVSEYRIESGLNCGGHAFPTVGVLFAPILESFRDHRDTISTGLFPGYAKALAARGLPEPRAVPPVRITAQGGIGTATEDRLVREYFGLDGTGWASPFLMVPEVSNVSETTLRALQAAKPGDIRITWGSPLGVPFWSLRTSGSEVAHRQRIEAGRPGSPCPKGHIALDQEFGEVPLCRASRGYQRRKLAQVDAQPPTDVAGAAARGRLRARILSPTCICHDLGGDVKRLRGIEEDVTPSICPGPNTRWFQRQMTLEEMVGHVYGKVDMRTDRSRPHQLVTEAELYVEYLERELEEYGTPLGQRRPAYFVEYVQNLLDGLTRSQKIASVLPSSEQGPFLAALTALAVRVRHLRLPSEGTTPSAFAGHGAEAEHLELAVGRGATRVSASQRGEASDVLASAE